MAAAPYLGPGSAYYELVHADDHLMEEGVRYGSAEPRIATPPLRELTPDTTWGFSVVEFASEVLSINLMPWQRALLLRALERREDGSLRFATVIGEVARQSGKSKISQILSLWGMLVRGWPLVLGTAQDLSTAEEVWEGAVAILLDDEELAPLVDKVMRVNGQKSLKLKNGSRYLVKAANRSAGRGLSGQLIVMDELREQRNWNAYSAISKIRQAQSESLVIGISNAGDISSVVLKHLREMAHAALGDPDGIVGDKPPADAEAAGDDELFEDDDTLAIFEWSAVPKCDIRDRDAWAAANPALGWRIKERTIAADARTDPEWVFRTEVLCQWPDGALMGPFPPGAWETGQNVPGERVDGSKYVLDDDKIVGPFDVCIDQSSDRSMYSITAVGKRRDGKDQAELIAYRSGNDWIKDFLTSDERCVGRVRRITGQTRGAPVSSFMAALLEAYEEPTDPFRIETVSWGGPDLIIAHQILFDAVSDASVRHNLQPQLDLAAGTAATKQLNGGFVIDRASSPADAAPLVAMCGALWLARKRSTEPPPPPPAPKGVHVTPNPLFGGTKSMINNLRNVGF